MTISGITSAVRARQSEADGNVSTFAADADVDNLLGKLIQFVPVELITTWTVAIGLFKDPSDRTVLGILALACVVLIGLTLFDISDKNKADKEKNPDSKPVSRPRVFFTCLFLVALFVIWALATAGSPLDQAQRVGCTVGGIFLGILAPRIAKVLDIKPST